MARGGGGVRSLEAPQGDDQACNLLAQLPPSFERQAVQGAGLSLHEVMSWCAALPSFDLHAIQQ